MFLISLSSFRSNRRIEWTGELQPTLVSFAIEIYSFHRNLFFISNEPRKLSHSKIQDRKSAPLPISHSQMLFHTSQVCNMPPNLCSSDMLHLKALKFLALMIFLLLTVIQHPLFYRGLSTEISFGVVTSIQNLLISQVFKPSDRWAF